MPEVPRPVSSVPGLCSRLHVGAHGLIHSPGPCLLGSTQGVGEPGRGKKKSGVGHRDWEWLGQGHRLNRSVRVGLSDTGRFRPVWKGEGLSQAGWGPNSAAGRGQMPFELPDTI